jgi:GntR family transcriptional regulator
MTAKLVRAEPLYRQLAATLREGITSGQYPPGTLLPSESALMKEHGVSRPTVRDAFDVLSAEGLIRTYNGKGRMVRGKTDTPARTLTRDAQAAEAFQPAGKPRRYRSPADPDIAHLLGISTDEPTFVEERTHTDPDTDDTALYQRILPFTVAETTTLEETPYPDRPDLLRTLADAYGPFAWTEYVRARMPHPEEAAALNTAVGTPIIETIRIATADDRPLIAETERRNADTVQYAYPLSVPSPGTGM